MEKLKPPIEGHECKSLENCEFISISKRDFGGKERWMWERSQKDGKIAADEITHCPYCGIDLNRDTVPDNKLLTLEQLREMDGKPVWCDWVNGWVLIYIDGTSELNFLYSDGSSNSIGELIDCLGPYGKKWIAYASKLKENAQQQLCTEDENFIQTKFGYCFYTLEYCPLIYNLYVHPQYRHQGHSRTLLELVIAEIRKNGYEGKIRIQAKPRENSIGLADLTKYYKSLELIICNARKPEGSEK